MKGLVLKLFLVLVMFVGVSQNAICDPYLEIKTTIPVGVNLSCSGKYYFVMTLDNETDVISRGSFTLSVYDENVILTVSDYPKPITYVNHNWKIGLLDFLCRLYPTAQKFNIELTSD